MASWVFFFALTLIPQNLPDHFTFFVKPSNDLKRIMRSVWWLTRLYLILLFLPSLITSPHYFLQAYWLPLLFPKYSGQRLSEGFCTCSCFCFQYSSYKQCYISPTLGFCPVLNLEIFYLPIHSFIFLHSTYLTSDLLFYYVYSFCLLFFCIHTTK